tara:strand:+ start:2192 stop:2428 length:237 start_codon:yes stop_codon:yes gene_type:complete
MKTKELEGALVDESIGDAHSHKEWEGWLEANLMSMMADYARESGYPTGYEFGKAMEAMALEIWQLMNDKQQENDVLPF